MFYVFHAFWKRGGGSYKEKYLDDVYNGLRKTTLCCFCIHDRMDMVICLGPAIAEKGSKNPPAAPKFSSVMQFGFKTHEDGVKKECYAIDGNVVRETARSWIAGELGVAEPGPPEAAGAPAEGAAAEAEAPAAEAPAEGAAAAEAPAEK